MTFNLLRQAVCGALAAGVFGTAHAVPATLTDPITQTPNIEIDSTANPLVFDLNAYGYDPLLHSLDSALLSLAFTVFGRNPNQINNANSSIVTISVPGQANFATSVASFNLGTDMSVTAAALNFASGLLQFSLTRSPNPGEVTLTSATLRVTASDLQTSEPGDIGGGDTPGATQSVPEPGTLALLGLSLLGGVLLRRRAD